ncbi:MarR family winged helix-turn-helix transcriptional regulator [Actinomadura rupiterrae]|uniref:MarR family winged helix-turn-helix transcriptional regulator n=1 Tax=Actinomadura rupiterrae TaxID=559627 RepID=UPI0020A4F760|nr:MarR family winged helix-turn-helix transcriptional regulator [Actinomadura rupiterrae]MCP2341431.1 DNA-binding MarR family transcriptional regulator [Actinomadura rupiterrae]
MNNTPPPVELAAHLRAAVSALVRSTRSVDRLPAVPAAVLDLLDTRGPMTTADLAAARGVRHQTMAATVKELADARLISPAPDPFDARKKVLTLTDAGHIALDADRRQRIAVLAETLSAVLDDSERNILDQALPLIDRIAESVARDHPPAPSPLTGPWQ